MTRRERKANAGPSHLGGYQLMWMLVTFDLPVETPELSNYLRFCNGKEQFDSYVRRIGAKLPEFGDVYIFQFTDRQYENVVRFSGQGRRPARKNPVQMALL